MASLGVEMMECTLPSPPPTPPKEAGEAGLDGNRNELPTEEDMQLLAKMREANRQIETDSKSLNSLSNNSGHSRRSSDTSQVSVGSGGSNSQNGTEAEEIERGPQDEIWNLWGQIVNDWESFSKKKNVQLKDLVRKGVPHHFRGIVWQLLCGSHSSPLKNKYVQYIKAQSPCEKVIRRDIARTYPEHEFFKEKDGFGQESLFNVMKAYSLHDREVGYCQGSAFIVGLLLMQQMPEEDAFATFVKLMVDYRLREMFKPSMSELGLCMYQLECLVQELLPEIHIHFQSQSFHTSMYASSWFLTLFATAFPLPMACRIFDVFLLEGIETIFRVAVAILQHSRDQLLQLDMEGMLKYFQKEMPVLFEADPDSLMHLAYQVKYNAKKMKKLEKDYTVMKTKEQEDQVELRRLRQENRLLRQRVDQLEKESIELAEKLLQGQVRRAQEEESNFEIQRELEAMRARDRDSQRKLEESKDRIRKLSQMMEDSSSSVESSLQEASLKTELLQQKEELIQCLQNELVKVRLREAENEVTVRDFRTRVQELEEDKKQLRESTPDHSVANMQEEIIAVKLREGEQKHENTVLRQRLSELRQEFDKYVQDAKEERAKNGGGSEQSTPAKKIVGSLPLFNGVSRSELRNLEEEVLAHKMRETEVAAEAAYLKQRIMELEAQTQVSCNQVKRAEDELEKHREDLYNAQTRVRTLEAQVKEKERKYADLEGRMKEELMMVRIRDAEKSQCVAELTHKISSLEFKNQELVIEGELSRGSAKHAAANKACDELENLGNEGSVLRSNKGSVSSLSDDDPEDLRLKVADGYLDDVPGMTVDGKNPASRSSSVSSTASSDSISTSASS